MEMSSIEVRNIADDGGFQTNGNPRAGFENIRAALLPFGRRADGSMRISDDDDAEKQIQEILARFSDGPESTDVKVPQVKDTLKAFLESASGRREERQLIVLDKLP
jgi:hypothetical protein